MAVARIHSRHTYYQARNDLRRLGWLRVIRGPRRNAPVFYQLVTPETARLLPLPGSLPPGYRLE